MQGIDLHVHSDFSPDGDLSIDFIFKKAIERDVCCIAITDHNSVEGLERAEKISKEFSIEFIPGVEFNSNYEGRDVHILAYFVDRRDVRILELIEEVTLRKDNQARERVKKLKELGFIIDYEDVLRAARGKIPNGSVFFDALIENPENRGRPDLKRYIDGDRSDSPHFNFYKDYFRYGKPAYVPLAHVSTEKVIEVILSAGSVPVLAHPYDIPDEEIIRIIKLGIAGIEAYSSYHTEEQNRHFSELAGEYNLLVTAGSDFHGSHKPKVELGIFFDNGMEMVEKLKRYVEINVRQSACGSVG